MRSFRPTFKLELQPLSFTPPRVGDPVGSHKESLSPCSAHKLRTSIATNSKDDGFNLLDHRLPLCRLWLHSSRCVYLPSTRSERSCRSSFHTLPAPFSFNITVTLGGNERSVGKMYMDVVTAKWTEKVLLQPHMQPLVGGQSYSSQQSFSFPIEEVTSVSITWFKKKLAFGGNSLQFQNVIIEPQYLTSAYEKRLKTKVFCGYTTPTVAKSEYPVSLGVNCRGW